MKFLKAGYELFLQLVMNPTLISLTVMYLYVASINNPQLTTNGISLADGAGATISSPWDFSQKILVIFARGSSDFLQVPRKRQIPRAEACSSENVGGVNNLI